MKWARIVCAHVLVQDGKARLECSEIKKGSIVVAVIHGGDVSSRDYSDNDPIIRRIKSSNSLLWSIRGDKLVYVSREIIDPVLSTLSNVYIAEIVVSGNDDEITISEETDASLSKLSKILSCRPLLNAVAMQWYYRLRLPVLSFWLCVLLLNMFLMKNFENRIGQEQRQLKLDSQLTEQARVKTERNNKMMSEYNSLLLPFTCKQLDCLASVLPDGMTLRSIRVLQSGMSVEGYAVDVSSVVAYSQLLTDLHFASEISFIGEDQDGTFSFKIALK